MSAMSSTLRSSDRQLNARMDNNSERTLGDCTPSIATSIIAGAKGKGFHDEDASKELEMDLKNIPKSHRETVEKVVKYYDKILDACAPELNDEQLDKILANAEANANIVCDVKEIDGKARQCIIDDAKAKAKDRYLRLSVHKIEQLKGESEKAQESIVQLTSDKDNKEKQLDQLKEDTKDHAKYKKRALETDALPPSSRWSARLARTMRTRTCSTSPSST